MEVVWHEAVRNHCKLEQRGQLPKLRQHGRDGVRGCKDVAATSGADRERIPQHADVRHTAQTTWSLGDHATDSAIGGPDRSAGLKACTTTTISSAGLKACTTTSISSAGLKACTTTCQA